MAMNLRNLLTIALALLLSVAVRAQDATSETTEKTPLLWPASLEQYHKRFSEFDKQDAVNMPAPGCTVFAGSSSITGWNLIPEDFKDVNALNRGFGGAIIPHWLLMVDRYIIRYKPAKVVFYCGENDIAGKQSPEQVRDNLEKFLDRIHIALPKAKIYFISLKPSRSRWKLWPTMSEANKLCKELCDRLPHAAYIDVSDGMLDGNGEPRKAIFRDDNLHMNRTGYTEIWIPQIRKAFAGKVVLIGPSMRRELCHAGLVDAEFLTEQGDLLMGAIKIGFQANSGVGAIGRPASSVGHGELARLITCKIADLTREVQLLGNGRVSDDDFAGTGGSRRLFEEGPLKSTINRR